MRLLLDTNIVLDILLGRGQWLPTAGAIWQASQDGRLTGCITASSITDIYYIIRKAAGAAAARKAISDCLSTLAIVDVAQADLEAAFNLAIPDFEDALQVACAPRAGLDAIVTRDLSGFPNAPLPIWSPTELIAHLSPPEAP